MYHAIQSPTSISSSHSLASLDAEIASLRENLASLKSVEKGLKNKLSALTSTLSIPELVSATSSLSAEKDRLLERLEPLRAGTVSPLGKEEKEAIENEWRRWKECAEARKRICMDFWGMCTEVLPEGKTEIDVWEERGLEGDEDTN